MRSSPRRNTLSCPVLCFWDEPDNYRRWSTRDEEDARRLHVTYGVTYSIDYVGPNYPLTFNDPGASRRKHTGDGAVLGKANIVVASRSRLGDFSYYQKVVSRIFWFLGGGNAKLRHHGGASHAGVHLDDPLWSQASSCSEQFWIIWTITKCR